MNIRLTEDQKESLEAFLDSEGFKVFTQVVLPQFKQFQVDKLLKGPETELILERAKYQGMELVEFRLKELKEYLIGKSAKPN